MYPTTELLKYTNNDECRSTCNDLLSKLEAKSRVLRSKRRLKGKIMKGDYMVSDERGYQHLIDQAYTALRYGLKQYSLMKSEPPNHNNNG